MTEHKIACRVIKVKKGTGILASADIDIGMLEKVYVPVWYKVLTKVQKSPNAGSFLNFSVPLLNNILFALKTEKCEEESVLTLSGPKCKIV